MERIPALDSDSISLYRHQVLEQKKEDVLLLPVFPGKYIKLIYTDGLIRGLTKDQQAVLKRSGYKPRLYVKGAGIADSTFGGWQPKIIEVFGYVTKYNGLEWFIATGGRCLEVQRGEKKLRQINMNNLLILNLLHSKGFLNAISLLSWATIVGYDGKKALSKKQPLPRTKADLLSLAEDRLKAVNRVLDGAQDRYWNAPLPDKKLRPKRRLLPATKVTALQVAVW